VRGSAATDEVAEISLAALPAATVADIAARAYGYSFHGRWCDEPATEKQLAVLRRAGILATAGLTRGGASEQIARLLRARGVA
jgi:hypothetical protein